MLKYKEAEHKNVCYDKRERRDVFQARWYKQTREGGGQENYTKTATNPITPISLFKVGTNTVGVDLVFVYFLAVSVAGDKHTRRD